MKRFGQIAQLKPEKITEYKRLHAQVWPDVLITITACNIHNYTIFLKETELFAYFEYIGGDYEKDMKKMADDPVTQEWWKRTKPCFLHHDTQTYYTDMDEIFHHDQYEEKGETK